MFGDRYKELLKSQQFLSPKIMNYFPYGDDNTKGWKNKFEAWGIFFMIDDSFDEK